MTVFFSTYFSSVRYSTRIHWKSHFSQGTRNTQPCIAFHPVKRIASYFKKKKLTWFFFDYIHTVMLLVPLILNRVVVHLCILYLWYNARVIMAIYTAHAIFNSIIQTAYIFISIEDLIKNQTPGTPTTPLIFGECKIS